ncbi:hypothetical protein BGZ88_004422, partial [Linnemannia elongata]
MPLITDFFLARPFLAYGIRFPVSANTAFTPLQLQEVRALCKVQEMDRKEPEVDDLVKVLAETLETGTIEEVMEKTYDLQVQSPSLRRVLHVLQVIIRNIIRPLHGKWNPSEADALHVWSSIFHEGMPMDTPVAFRLGEQGCAATAFSKSKLEAVFSTGSSPRKCDCLLTAGGIEVGNFECLSATIFKIVKYEDIWVGATACVPVLLPEEPGEFEHFLSDHLQSLMNLLHQYDAYGRNVVREANRSKFRKKALEDHEEDQCSQNAMETLEWETPTKPVKSTLLEYHLPLLCRCRSSPSRSRILRQFQSVRSIQALMFRISLQLQHHQLGEKLKPTDGKSKHRGKLTQRLANDTEKYISHIRRIAREVDFLQDRLMQYDSLSKDEALLAAFKELDDLVELRSRDGHYSYNQAKELLHENWSSAVSEYSGEDVDNLNDDEELTQYMLELA